MCEKSSLEASRESPGRGVVAAVRSSGVGGGLVRTVRFSRPGSVPSTVSSHSWYIPSS